MLRNDSALAALKDALITLEAQAELRLTSTVPAGAERAWDLREDILDALRVFRKIAEGAG